MQQPLFSLPVLVLVASGLLAGTAPAQAAFSADLFGYRQSLQPDPGLFAQWLQVLQRHILLDTPQGDCIETTFNRCHLDRWLEFLDTQRGRPRAAQIEAVNQFANARTYVLDIDNYGVEDYWAVVREFLDNNGDCEDYALTKLFSLLWLGFASDELRIVVLQDTNLRIPHAVLAVAQRDDILILDNQTAQVISHHEIVHYAPVYSINEKNWWIHIPN